MNYTLNTGSIAVSDYWSDGQPCITKNMGVNQSLPTYWHDGQPLVSVGGATFSLSGRVATLLASRLLQGTGSYALTGSPAQFHFTQRIMNTDVGSYTLTGSSDSMVPTLLVSTANMRTGKYWKDGQPFIIAPIQSRILTHPGMGGGLRG